MHPDVLLRRLNVIYSKSRWYLSFSPVRAGLDGFCLCCLLSHIGEFGERVFGGVLYELRLSESGVVAASDADAERLFRLAAYSPAANSDATAAFTSSAPKT